MEELVIRNASLRDLDVILSLSDELTQSDLPYDRQIKTNWSHTTEGIAYYRGKIEETTGKCFVALLNDTIVGYITCGIKDVPTYRKVTVVELENLLVSSSYQRRGIGRKLIQSFRLWAKEIKADKLCVNVFSGNENALAFYRNEGFLPFETILESKCI